MTFFSQLPLVVSYYTKGTPYEDEVKDLVSSCERFELEHCIEGVADLGSWEKNCAFKPYFMQKKMERYKRPLLWVDADAVFLQPLSFEEFMFSDVALVRNLLQTDPRFCVNAGTVYINSTRQGMQSLALWCRYAKMIEQEENAVLAFQDQVSLHFAVLATPVSCIGNIPKSYF